MIKFVKKIDKLKNSHQRVEKNIDPDFQVFFATEKLRILDIAFIIF